MIFLCYFGTITDKMSNAYFINSCIRGENLKRFSQMTAEEIHHAIEEMKHEIRELEKKNLQTQIEVVNKRIDFAKSYLIDPSTIQIGKAYKIANEEGRFIVKYLNGVMAWGSFEHSREEQAFPFANMTLIEEKES